MRRVSTSQPNRETATQSVPHVHFHLAPRWSDDSVRRIWPPETNYLGHPKDKTWGEALLKEVR